MSVDVVNSVQPPRPIRLPRLSTVFEQTSSSVAQSVLAETFWTPSAKSLRSDGDPSPRRATEPSGAEVVDFEPYLRRRRRP